MAAVRSMLRLLFWNVHFNLIWFHFLWHSGQAWALQDVWPERSFITLFPCNIYLSTSSRLQLTPLILILLCRTVSSGPSSPCRPKLEVIKNQTELSPEVITIQYNRCREIQCRKLPRVLGIFMESMAFLILLNVLFCFFFFKVWRLLHSRASVQISLQGEGEVGKVHVYDLYKWMGTDG